MTTQTIGKIPMLDLNAQYDPIKDQILSEIEKVFDSKQFIGGPKIAELEAEVAKYTNTKHAIGVSSGTDALVAALMALEIGNGDEVITTPFTFFATVGSIHRVGATPIFCDIDPQTFNINTDQIESKITEKTKAIMPVHLFGQTSDMAPILDLAKKYNLKVIEDAAQAIGAKYQFPNGEWKNAGEMGDFACFSFFPSKNLGGCGDGGVVTTNSDQLAERLKMIRNHGAKQKYFHDFVGGNFRLDAMQAAILLVKLPLLNGWHDGRRKNAAILDEGLSGHCETPEIAPNYHSIYNQYTLRFSNRDPVKEVLDAANIGNAIYYPLPLHLQKCFAYLNHKEGDFPESEKAAKEVLSIPVYPELTEKQLQHIIETLKLACA